jgi:hypothetical protein
MRSLDKVNQRCAKTTAALVISFMRSEVDV